MVHSRISHTTHLHSPFLEPDGCLVSSTALHRNLVHSPTIPCINWRMWCSLHGLACQIDILNLTTFFLSHPTTSPPPSALNGGGCQRVEKQSQCGAAYEQRNINLYHFLCGLLYRFMYQVKAGEREGKE